MRTTWTVVVVYEDTAMRDSAVELCDELVKKFWSQCEFEARWWSFALLQDPQQARGAADKAVEAGVIIFATHAEGELPFEVMAWTESWLSRREDREGALIGLIDWQGRGAGETLHKDPYLRQVAHRAGMDYLTHVPQSMAYSIPDSLDSYSERAGQVTGVLDEILHHHPQPPLPHP